MENSKLSRVLKRKVARCVQKSLKSHCPRMGRILLDKEKRREIFTLYYQEPFPQAVILKRWLFLFCFPGGVASVHKWLTKNIVPFSYDLLGLFLRIWISPMTHMETKECWRCDIEINEPKDQRFPLHLIEYCLKTLGYYEGKTVTGHLCPSVRDLVPMYHENKERCGQIQDCTVWLMGVWFEWECLS